MRRKTTKVQVKDLEPTLMNLTYLQGYTDVQLKFPSDSERNPAIAWSDHKVEVKAWRSTSK